MPALDWRLSEDEAFLEQVKHVERWTKPMAVMTSENIESFAGLKIDKKTKPRSIFLGIYGVGGAGKTTTLGQIVLAGEDGAPALLVDIDRSSDAVLHLQEHGLHIMPISTWEEARKILAGFKSGGTPWKSVIFDNISELLALCVKYYAPKGMPQGSDALKIWGSITADMMEYVRDIRTYCSRDGINLLMSLWEETEKDPNTEITRIKVLLTPKFGAAFPGMATMLGRISVPGSEKNNYVRLLNFAPDDRFDNKYRVAPTDAAADIPLQLYLSKDTAFIVDFLNTIKHDVKFPRDRYVKPTNKP